MTALLIAFTVVISAAAALAAARGRFHAEWGRAFDREINRYLTADGTWVDAASTTDALSLDLIRRSDLLMGARA
jgi:hypothetical protein